MNLASVDQLADRLGTLIDPADARADRLLADASAFFRSFTHQEITLHEDDEVELLGSWERSLLLPQRPVVAVSDVAIRNEGATAFTARAVGGYTVQARRNLVLQSGGYWGGLYGSVRLTYAHGYEEVPADVVACVLSLAERAWRNPTNATSTSKTIGSASTSETFGEISQVGVTAMELVTLAKYRDG